MGILSTSHSKKDQKTIHFSLVQADNLLLIFTRNPELGKCKTRLAAKVGDKIALDVYNFLLSHTVKITENINAAKEVYYSNEIWEEDIWDNTFYRKKLQVGKDLGERMLNAFQQGFENGYKKIVIIGSDIFNLSGSDIENAFLHLDHVDLVIGPAEDGGYYLLGMNAMNSKVFQNKNWGTDTVLNDTLTDLKNKKVQLLETKNDVDRYEDIKDVAVFQHFLKNLK
ncbi:TIGR04282 family arsenosugar biosynthesis glycosyltransferase [Flavobacteriaceae bacterium F89]|uniref:TIGR04282 family arsenosugar biosynthesis glycosyltransferase n=1 Tax=Cerina litoralis TaxID=2874477 RepID=A0AAE3JQ63_9FLAO|nr:TIGR04282 family arsenosugar biosynthesis glycosyltransferase [Cerina litoralis]MCG2459898.1 TIGR04282 family arsenosugar biosynthesis glycosyltransferase [Cerina litoralis]